MKTVYIKTTETCNLDCPHCYTSGSLGRKVYWRLEKVKQWIGHFQKSLPEHEPVHYEIHGGEPFLCNTNDLLNFVKFIKKHYPNASVGLTSNLVFKLTNKRLQVIEHLDTIGTSYDVQGRFNEKTLKQWEDNVKLIRALYPSKQFICNTVVSTPFIKTFPPKEYIDYMRGLNFKHLRLERITLSGNAIINHEIVPKNKEASDYYFKLYQYLEYNHLLDEVVVLNLDEITAKVNERNMHVGTYHRQCEQNIFTLNADGTLAGCPNDAPVIQYGTVEQSLSEVLVTPKRIIQIQKESVLNDSCYDCNLLDYCGGGCYKLHWDDTGCPTPKQLINYLIERK